MEENSDYLERRKRRTTVICYVTDQPSCETVFSVWTCCVFVLDGQWKQALLDFAYCPSLYYFILLEN